MQCKKKQPAHNPFAIRCTAVIAVVLLGTLFAFCRYVNTRWKPTLYDMAEYEARAAVTAALNGAISEAMAQQPALYQNLYQATETGVQLDATAANRARAALVAATTAAVEALPETDRVIPYGSLTDNSLIGGLGPGWHLSLRPQGYVQAELYRRAEIIGVNTTHYTASVRLETVVNMILNSYKNTITVAVEVPLADLVLCGDTPAVYAVGED